MTENKKPNRLIHEKSPYLLQHAYNPVSWYPWQSEAFEHAKEEDKPIFLSIGYSTCHWCHVMAHESFEDEMVAERLNLGFISIKVDREERPDIDGVYMRACQAMTGGGGWPTSIFMSADGKPFFAGTYFPKDNFLQILDGVTKAWKQDREDLLENGGRLVRALDDSIESNFKQTKIPINEAVVGFQRSFDKKYGGFGRAPKFPSAHNLLFLLNTAPELAEKTLDSMYRGGIFDHIGGGFSRYSTDREWLVPHFEKMLYDNALLAIAYLLGYEKIGKEYYRTIAERIFDYLEREMHDSGGGYYSAQDADSEGVEGKYYLFTPDELIALLGENDGLRFCKHFGITVEGNFEGKSIPNLLHGQNNDRFIDALIPKVYEYRMQRIAPHKDMKKLTAWNALTVAAYAMAARILKKKDYLDIAKDTVDFIERELIQKKTIFVSITEGVRSGHGFLDDYSFYIFALIQMHQASQDEGYLARALELCDKALELYWDEENNGFFFSGKDNETLICRPKETWDGAMPSGNSVMAYNLLRLSMLTDETRFIEYAEKQQSFMNGKALEYPMGYGFYLWSMLPVKKIVCTPHVPSHLSIRTDWVFHVLNSPDYPPINGKTTYYVCENDTCRPPVNEL